MTIPGPPFDAPSGEDLVAYEREIQRLLGLDAPVETCPLCFREAHPDTYCFGVEAAPIEDDERTCERCGDAVQYLSTEDLCDGCVAYNDSRVTL